jgi:hypothetical protein
VQRLAYCGCRKFPAADVAPPCGLQQRPQPVAHATYYRPGKPRARMLAPPVALAAHPIANVASQKYENPDPNPVLLGPYQ